MSFTRKKATLVTHNDGFHADDVFATATLLLVLEKTLNLRSGEWQKRTKIIRTRDKEVIERGDYVYDVGGIYDPDQNRFDHHQEGGAGERENKIPYSSFGLIWKKYGEKLSGSKELAEKIDRRIVQPVDAMDNGISIYKSNYSDVHPYLLHDIIQVFDPVWPEKKDYDKNFLVAVDFAKKLLERTIIQFQNVEKAEKEVQKIYKNTKDKRIIVFDDNYPWVNILNKYPEPLFVIYPKSNGWGIKTVPVEINSFERRKEFPKTWAGKKDQELVRITGIKTAIFCHNHRFVCATKTKEGAIKLAELALDE